MKWRKLGRIFDPTRHPLPPGCREYAQAPQALACHDRLRVYFSTRERTGGGKVLSRVAYADFDPSLSRVLRTSTREVLPLGELGSFDEHGVFPLHVLRDGPRLRGYIGGWSRRVAVPIEGAIGLCESRDGGETFERLGPGPVLAAALQEPFMVADPFVLRHGERLHMWYIFGTRWIRDPQGGALERVYKIAHATSGDGVRWERESRPIVADLLGPEECQALPTVAWHGGRWHMLFCYRQAFGFRTDRTRAYRLGHCWSEDLHRWTREDEGGGLTVSAEGWDSDMLCYPHLFTHQGRLHLLYNGNEFGRHGFGAAVAED